MTTRELERSVTRRTATADVAVPVVIALVVLILGALRVGDRSLWADELFTLDFVLRPIVKVIADLQHEAAMGPYYLVLVVWTRFGDSASWLRMFSVVGAAATAVATYELVRQNLGRRVALVSVVGLVCNPVFVRNATELRAYSWMMFATVLTTALVLRVSSRPDSTWTLVGFGIGAGVLIALNIFCVFFVAVQLGWAVLQSRPRDRARIALIVSASIAAVLIPFLPAYATSDQVTWIPPLSLDQVRSVAVDSLGGNVWLVVLLLGTVCSVAMLASGRGSHRARSLVVLAIASSTAFSAGLLVLAVFRPVLVSRYLSPMVPLVVIAASYGLVVGLATFTDRGSMGRSVLSAALVAFYLIGFPGSPFRDPVYGEDFRSVGQFLSSHVEPGDAVVLHPSWLLRGVEYYWRPNTDVIAWDADQGRLLTTKEQNAQSKEYCRVFSVDRQPPVREPDPDASVRRFMGRFGWLTITRIDRC